MHDDEDDSDDDEDDGTGFVLRLCRGEAFIDNQYNKFSVNGKESGLGLYRLEVNVS